MAHFNAQHPPLFQPLPFNDIGQTAEWNIPAAPVLGLVPLPEFDDTGLAFPQWLPHQFGEYQNAERRYGLLTPPKTPLPLFLDDIREHPHEPMPVLTILNDVQGGQFVLDIAYINVGMQEGLDDDGNFGPPPIPMLIDDNYAQENGPGGFDVDAMGAEFKAVFDENEEESETATDEGEFHPGLITSEASPEHDEWCEDREEEWEEEDEMDWVDSEAQDWHTESWYSSGGK